MPDSSLDPVKLPLASAARSDVLEMPDGPLTVRRSILPGGVRVITEELPGTQTTTLGLWVATGSRDEQESEAGASHFLEHLLFKGTPTRSAFDIAAAFDEVGGESNAATSKETTHYWAKTLDSDADMTLATLTDMVTSSLITDEDVNTERTVIIDELAMAEDSPADVVHEAFATALFGDDPLGRPIGGTTASVSDLPAETIRELYRRHYHSRNLIVAGAGHLDHEQICAGLSQALALTDWDRDEAAAPASSDLLAGTGSEPPLEVVDRREVEQAHILVGSRWLNATDEQRPTSNVLLTILGGGMSSRLFQEIRERRGLAYTTYAFDSAYLDTGYFGLYAGCAPENVDEVERIMWGEVEKLAEAGVPEAELRRAKGQLRGNLALGLESSASRMMRLGRSEVTERFISVDAALARIEAVQVEEIRQMAEQMLAGPRARALVTNR